MYFGPGIEVTPVPVDEQGEPPAESVDTLAARIESALDDVTLQADSHNALHLSARAERIFTGDADRGLAHELEMRRRFVAGYAYLRAHDDLRLARLESHVARFDAHALASRPGLAAKTIGTLLLLPLAAGGPALPYPLYPPLWVLSPPGPPG